MCGSTAQHLNRAFANLVGPLCSLCEDGLFFSDSTGTCDECPDSGGRASLLIGLLAVLIFVMAAAWKIATSPPRAFRQLSRRMHQAWVYVGEVGFRAKMKQLISFLQGDRIMLSHTMPSLSHCSIVVQLSTFSRQFTLWNCLTVTNKSWLLHHSFGLII